MRAADQPLDAGGAGVAWFARIAVGAVFALNVSCALAFIARPLDYAPGFELAGDSGRFVVQGIGILFLMWNATYPPVLWRPQAHRTLFGVILAQQVIGVVGESWLWLQLPEGHAAISATGLRFIAFDGAGLLAMVFAYALMARARGRRGTRASPADGSASRAKEM